MKYCLSFIASLILSSILTAQIDYQIIQGDAVICPGASSLMILDATDIDSVSWFPSATLSAPNSLSTIATPTMPTTYTATLYKFNQTETVSIFIDIFSLDIGPDQSICQQNGPLTLEFGPDLGSNIYSVINSGGLNISQIGNGNSAIVSTTTAQADTYEVVVGIPSCDLLDTMNITIFSGLGPIVDYPEDRIVICSGDDILLEIPAITGEAYTWSTGGMVLSTTNSVTVSPTSVTTYVIEAINTTCDLPSRDSVMVIPLSPPALNLPPTIDACENDFVTLGMNPEDDRINYEWSPVTNITDPTAANAELFVTASGTYTLTASCLEPITIAVNMIPNDLEFEEDTVFICLGESATISPTIIPPNSTISWVSSDGSFNSNLPSITVSPGDVTSYYATVSNNNCDFTDTVVVQVDSIPSHMTLVPSMVPVCQGDTVRLQTFPLYEESSFPNILSVWSPNDSQDYETSDSLFQMIIIASETKEYTRVTTNGACVDTSKVEVLVVPVLEFEVSEDTICSGESVQLQVIARQEGEIVDPSRLEFMWMSGTDFLTCDDCPNPTADPPTTTTFAFEVTLDDNCPFMGMLTITVFVPPSIDWADKFFCPISGPFPLLDVVNPDFEYVWSSDPFDPTLDVTSNNPMVNPMQTTTYSVTVSNGAGFCPDLESEREFIPYPNVTVEIGELPTGVCPGEEIFLSANGQGPGGTYVWNYAGQTNDEQEFSFEPQIPTVFNVSYTDEFGCFTATDQESVDVYGLPPDATIMLQPDTCDFAEGDQVVFTLGPPNTLPGNLDITWTDRSGDVVGTGNPVTISISDIDKSNTYTATIITQDGCETTAKKFVNVDPASIEYPNIFAPGSNIPERKIFHAIRNGNVQVLDFRIYDRWGNKVYDNEQNDIGWDGLVNGKEAPTDVYIFIMTTQIPGQDAVTEKGDVTLIR